MNAIIVIELENIADSAVRRERHHALRQTAPNELCVSFDETKKNSSKVNGAQLRDFLILGSINPTAVDGYVGKGKQLRFISNDDEMKMLAV